jgi:2-polyprenyl-6-methoxyphenol hydroxylase-like FAD-dependent oxidoreductase
MHRPTNNDVLISGAGIAGPAVAYWLQLHGFNPTVVERAPALREGARPSTSAGTHTWACSGEWDCWTRSGAGRPAQAKSR